MDEASLYKALWVPCRSKEALHRWIHVFLGVDLPDGRVDPDSNSSPMELAWEIYRQGLANDDPSFSRIMGFASRDSFKCVEKGTRLLSPSRGLVPIEDLSVGEVVWSGRAWRPITAWIHDGVKESVTLQLLNGIKLTTSPVHRVWSWSAGAGIGWKRVSSLGHDDWVCVDTSSTFVETTGTVDSEFDIGYLCGILQGDGCLTLMDRGRKTQNKRNRNTVSLSTADPFVLSFWKRMCLKYAQKEPRHPPNTYDWWIASKPMTDTLRSWGMTDSYAWEKKVPDLCWTSKSYMIGFLSGILDTDGSISQRNDIILATTGRKLAEGCLIMLHALGVNARLRYGHKLYGIQRHLVHSLIISQNDWPRLWRAGVRIRAQKARGHVLTESAKTSNSHDGVPRGMLVPLLNRLTNRSARNTERRPVISRSYGTVTRTKALALAEWACRRGNISEGELGYWRSVLRNKWIKVASVEVGTADFYDLTVDVDHSYWSNGLISHNTLVSAVLEILALFHLNRSVCHMAAIDQQAHKCQEYVKGFLDLPILRDFKVGDNITQVLVVWFQHRETKERISLKEWKGLTVAEREPYLRNSLYIRIVTCTIQSANGDHVPFFVVDEIDVIPKSRIAAYNQARAIPSVSPEGAYPITFLTSTRKFSFGLVQKEIDGAEASGLRVRHWNILDVTEACPVTRHRPDLPKLPIYRDDDTLRAIPEAEWKALPDDERKSYVKDEGYSGCLSNCKLFAVCRGRLATEQKQQRKTLKPIDHVINLFRSVPLEMAKAELLCRKASVQGLIYPRLEVTKHKLSAAQIYEKLVGEVAPAGFDKARLVEFAKSRGLQFYSGMDFGFTHYFAVVTGFRDGNRFFVVDVQGQTELEPDQQVALCDSTIRHMDPIIYADPENPQMARVFRRHGYHLKQWKKSPGSVAWGIGIVRLKLSPTLSEPELYFLRDDIGCDFLFRQMSTYHWTLNIDGTFSDEPDKVDDDAVDGLRYCIMNVFPQKGHLTVTQNVPVPEQLQLPPPTPSEVPPNRASEHNWLQEEIAKAVNGGGGSTTILEADDTVAPSAGGETGRKGGFNWSM